MRLQVDHGLPSRDIALQLFAVERMFRALSQLTGGLPGLFAVVEPPAETGQPLGIERSAGEYPLPRHRRNAKLWTLCTNPYLKLSTSGSPQLPRITKDSSVWRPEAK